MIPEAEEHGSAELSFVAFSQSSTTQLLFTVRRHDPWRLERTVPSENSALWQSARDRLEITQMSNAYLKNDGLCSAAGATLLR